MIDRYLRSHVLGVTGVVALVLLAIFSFLTLVAELEDLGEGNYGLVAILRYVALMSPEAAYLLAPLMALLGTLMGLGGLATNNELTAMRAAGVSLLRIALGVASAGLLLGLAAFAVGEFVLPVSTPFAETLRATDRAGAVDAARERGVWLRDGRQYVHIGDLSDERTLSRLELFEIDEVGRLVSTTNAERGEYKDGRWQFDNVARTRFTATGTETENLEQSTLDGVLTDRFAPDVLRLFVLEADSLSARGLYRYMRYLEDNALDAERARVEFWQKISVPFTVLAMMLVAVPFVVGPSRQSGAGQRLFIGILVGVTFFVVNDVTASTGLIYGLSPWLCAFLPTFLVAGIAALRLRTMR